MANISQKMAEKAVTKMAAVDPGILQRLVLREKTEAKAARRAPKIPFGLEWAARKGPRSKALGVLEKLWKPTKRVALVAGGIGAIGGIGYAGSKLQDALTYKKDFEGMLDFSPEIGKYDRKQVKARFDTLRRFSPEMSKDPLVASSWVKQTIEYPVVTPATLKDIRRPEKAISISEVARAVPRMVSTEF